jgi:hypothetical protein
MTDTEAEAMGRRLVACRHFRAMRGMRDMQGRTWTPDLLWRWAPGVDVPDMRDPATLGCLLALVREAWEPRRGTDHIASTVHTTTGWGVGARVGSECFAAIILPAFSSEAHALVAALESAP